MGRSWKVYKLVSGKFKKKRVNFEDLKRGLVL